MFVLDISFLYNPLIYPNPIFWPSSFLLPYHNAAAAAAVAGLTAPQLSPNINNRYTLTPDKEDTSGNLIYIHRFYLLPVDSNSWLHDNLFNILFSYIFDTKKKQKWTKMNHSIYRSNQSDHIAQIQVLTFGRRLVFVKKNQLVIQFQSKKN